MKKWRKKTGNYKQKVKKKSIAMERRWEIMEKIRINARIKL